MAGGSENTSRHSVFSPITHACSVPPARSRLPPSSVSLVLDRASVVLPNPMSSLRRLAQTNAAVSASPRTGGAASASAAASPSTPVRPSTPRTRLVYPISPVTSPSLSASQPFDWEAARSRRPPPYATPLNAKRKNRSSDIGTPGKTPSKRVVRKKSLYER